MINARRVLCTSLLASLGACGGDRRFESGASSDGGDASAGGAGAAGSDAGDAAAADAGGAAAGTGGDPQDAGAGASAVGGDGAGGAAGSSDNACEPACTTGQICSRGVCVSKVLFGGLVSTAAAPGGTAMKLVDHGFEAASPPLCKGNVCVSGGIRP